MLRCFAAALTLVLAAALGACGDSNDEDGTGPVPADAGPAPDEAAPPPADADPMADPKSSLAHQLALLEAGNTAELKACFTPRQQKRITPEAVAQGQEELSKYTLDDLWASTEEGEHQGRKTLKVKMKNGRTLTTLVLVDGKWLADTVWFK